MEENKKQYFSRTKGILSIVFALLYPLVGLILGIVAIVNSRKTLKLEPQNPEPKSGFVLGIVGTSLSGIRIAFSFMFSLLSLL